MKLQATSTGAISYDERVQTSMKGDKLCNDVTRYVAFNEEINAEIDSFVDAKNQIIGEIRGLHNVNYMQVLFKVYVQFKPLKIAASEMGKSYSYAIELHKKALTAFEETYKNLSYLT
jgi:DNA-binding MltR family transcriptional regulator